MVAGDYPWVPDQHPLRWHEKAPPTGKSKRGKILKVSIMSVQKKPNKYNSSTSKIPLEYALELAKLGFHVIPLPENEKKPPPTGWQKLSTTDPKQIKAWFQERRCNIGIDTGKFGDEGKSLVVIDVDNKNGKDGEQSLLDALGEKTLPETMEIFTPNNGRHLFFLSGTSFKTGANVLGDGVDIRATGGYVVGPGSSIGAKPYSGDLRLPAVLPDFVAELLDQKRAHSIIDDTSFENQSWFDSKACIEKATKLLRNATPAIEGQAGDNRTVSVANEVGDIGITRDVTLDLMLEHYNPRCVPPWEPEDLKKKVFSAYSSRLGQGSPLGINPPGEVQFEDVSHLISNDNRPGRRSISAEPRSDQKFKIVHWTELLNRPPVEYLVEGIFRERGVAFIGGQTTHMKTALVTSIACSIATGTNVGDKKTKEKTVLMLLNEGQTEFGQRIKAWADKTGNEEPDVYIIEKPPSLMDEASVKACIKDIEDSDINPGVIVLDTYSKATIGSDNNSEKDVNIALSNAYSIADHFKALVILIDHVGKNVKKGIRGSSAKPANVDMVGLVTRTKDRVVLYIEKQKDGRDDFSINFANINPNGAPVIVAADGSFPPVGHNDWIMSRLVLDGETQRDELKADFMKAYEASRQTFNKAFRRLIEKDKIQYDEDTGLVSEID